MWPPGPYAVPLTRDGCPENSDRGWEIGHIKISTRYSMSDKDSFNGCKDVSYQNQTDSMYPEKPFARIAGYFDSYELQINLCYKLPQYMTNFDIKWPAGNYSIYGVNNECPPGKFLCNSI